MKLLVRSAFAKRHDALSTLKFRRNYAWLSPARKISWSVMSSATSQLRGASWKLRIKFYPWPNVPGRTHTIIIQYNARKRYAD